MATFEFPVEKGHIITFARSLGEEDPIFVGEGATSGNDERPLVAPPTFTQASIRFSPENPMRRHLGASPGELPAERASTGRQLHAEQHFEYHRPVVAGEVLTVIARPGATWEKQGRRGGTLSFTETFVDYVDANGDVAITARTVGVVTSQVVETK